MATISVAVDVDRLLFTSGDESEYTKTFNEWPRRDWDVLRKSIVVGPDSTLYEHGPNLYVDYKNWQFPVRVYARAR